MPFGKWADFESCVVDIMKQNPDYDEETAKATCGKLKAQLEGKIFWQGTVKLVEGNKVTGQALHPIKTYHPNEWPQVRVYLEEELKKSAETLSGKPFGLDHIFVLSDPNRITRSWWENDAINYVGDVDDKVAEMIRKGEIKGVSVEYNWDLLQNVNGFAPRGLEFTSLHFLKNLEPGDPSASVKLAEALLTKLKEAKQSSPTATGQPAQPEPSQKTGVESSNQQELKKLIESEVRNQIKAILKEQHSGEEEKPTGSPVKPVLSEALITPTTPQPPLVIPVEKLEAIMPPLQAERSMSWGAQRLVQDLKRLILEARRGSIEQKK